MGEGLYLHVPFCRRACPYCDFDFVVGRTIDVDTYLDALAVEWRARAEAWRGCAFDTVYLGGGTPSLLGARGLDRVLEFARRIVPEGQSVESTVELNPEDVDDELLDVFEARGVDRISLGVQTFDERGLRQLGRVHDATSAMQAIELGLARGFRASVDLIVGWPGQDGPSLLADLARASDLGVSHLSVYALTIEADSAWPKLVRRGLRVVPDEDVQTDLLLEAEAELTRRGYSHYEISSYAREGESSRHNAKYWSGVDYLGLGPSAGSARRRGTSVSRRSNVRGHARWLADPSLAEEEERLEGQRAAAEALWLGLRRLDVGVATSELARYGVDPAWLGERIARQVTIGNLVVEGTHVRLAAGRWLFHQTIGSALFDGVESL